MSTRILIVGKASTISAQLAALQPLGLVPAGRPINPNSGTMPECVGGASALPCTTAEGGFLPPALRFAGGRLA